MGVPLFANLRYDLCNIMATSNQPCTIDIGSQRFEVGNTIPATAAGEYEVKVQAYTGAGKRIMCINAKTQIDA